MSESSKDSLQTVMSTNNQPIIIGLTGRTGSGCSTTRELLLLGSFDALNPPPPVLDKFNSLEDRKYRIVYQYAKANWPQFREIKVADVITFFLLNETFEKFKEYFIGENLSDIITSEFKSNFESLRQEISNLDWTSMAPRIGQFKREIKVMLNNKSKHLFVEQFQKFGNNIRISGKPFDLTYSPNGINAIPNKIDTIIKTGFVPPTDGPLIIIIDAIRNPFEARFFETKYSAFYLFAVKCDDEHRRERLRAKYNSTNEQLDDIDGVEYKNKLDGHEAFTWLNVKTCIRDADVHIFNPTKVGVDKNLLKKQLIRYVSLILHPGLVTPTNEERLMQIAYNAKFNSGCISRQVGAVVTDSQFYVKSIGWNEAANGQVPCLLRCVNDLLDNRDNEAFSTFEKSDLDFLGAVKNTFANHLSSPDLQGRNLAFCFKKIKNTIDDDKNQVHTRALHAEENAFLQISMSGGTGVAGGHLFVTDSPCELCCKKAYQLKISAIYYIDPYKGIAESHIIDSGNCKPKLELFFGANGKAYSKFFSPIMNYKDELDSLLNIEYVK